MIDFKMFDNMQKAIFEAKHLIQSNENIRKMLLIDSKNALESATPSYESASENIVVAAVFDITEEPFNKNTIMTVVLHRSSYDDENLMLTGMLKINILTRSELWELNNNKIRPLEITNEVIKVLNNKKVSASHKLYFSRMELAILNENVSGYSVIFFIEEGSGLDEQF